MATKNICTYPMEPALAKNANAIIEQDGKLKRVNLDWEFDKKANAIVSESDGAVIAVNDSSMARPKNLILCGKSTQKTTAGKNLFKVTAPATYNGVTLSEKDDYYVLNGTATSSSLFITKIGALEAGTYALSANNPKHNSLGQISVPIVQVYSPTTLESIAAIDDAVNKTSIVTIKGGENYETRIRIQEGITYDNFIIKPQFERNSVVTEYEPYTGGAPSPRPDWQQEILSVENPKIKVHGKNLYNCRDILNHESFSAGVIADDDFITLEADNTNGTAQIYKNHWTHVIQALKPNTDYRLVVEVKEITGCILFATSRKNPDSPESQFNENTDIRAVGTYDKIVRTNDLDWSTIEYSLRTFAQFAAGNSGKCVFRISLQEIDYTNTEYEPYKEPQVIPLTHTLHGIPVTTGGNYTDADGQQWICDEVDLERGVYVQRCFTETVSFMLQEGLNRYSGTLSHIANAECADGNGIPVLCKEYIFDPLCGSGAPMVNGIRVAATSPKYVIAYHNGEVIESATVMYPLAEPIETQLTDAEIYAFKNTEMNYPNTTILNDAGAFMKLDYFADTLKYVLKHGGGGGFSTVSKFEVTLPASGWQKASDNTYYSQVITVPGATADSKIDLQPTPAQLISLLNNGTSMFASNEAGTITVYVVGSKPTSDMTMQATKMEVVYV